jgi:hypothetical protein
MKRLLTSSVATSALEQENNELDLLLFLEIPKLSITELYNKRIDSIKYLMSTLWVEDLQNLSGSDVVNLFSQRDYIIERLSNISYAEILINNGYNFKEVLEGLVNTTLEHIEVYEKAEKLLTGKRIVTVIVDGNNHNITKDGKKVGIQTEIEDNMVTLEHCQRVTEKIQQAGHKPKKLQFMMSIYTETPGNDCGDFPEECLLNRNIYYYVEGNTLMIWEHGKPILQNINGDINDDQDALADCFL